MHNTRFIAIVAATLCWSCSDSFTLVPPFAGSYALISAEGRPLPIIFPRGVVSVVRWVSGSVVVLPNQHFSRYLVEQIVEGATVLETDTAYFSDSTAFYRQHGSDVRFYIIQKMDGGGVDTTELNSGTLRSDGSVLTVTGINGVEGVGTLLQYER